MNRFPGIFTVTVLTAAALYGQQAAVPDDTGTIFRSDTRVVDLAVTVTDKAGHLVTNLPRQAFTVYENGAAQEIRSFKREDVLVSMGLIIDNSSSMRKKRNEVDAAALALVRDSNLLDEVFVVNFNDEAHFDLPRGKDFTNNIKEMEEALGRADPSGGTAMRDAISLAIDHLKKKAHKDKKVLVVVTDGDDNLSRIGFDELLKKSQQMGVLIYSVGLLSEEEHSEAKHAEKALEALSRATGGEAFFPKELAEVEQIAHNVAGDIRNQYSIVYAPANQSMDGSFRQIRVAVKGPGGPNARTRTGYYATPDQARK